MVRSNRCRLHMYKRVYMLPMLKLPVYKYTIPCTFLFRYIFISVLLLIMLFVNVLCSYLPFCVFFSSNTCKICTVCCSRHSKWILFGRHSLNRLMRRAFFYNFRLALHSYSFLSLLILLLSEHLLHYLFNILS